MSLKAFNFKSSIGAGSIGNISVGPSKLNRRSKRRLLRYGLISGNILLLVIVAIFVISNRSASQTVRASTLNSASSTASSQTNPLDQLSAAQIALTAAQMANLPELTPIHNQADSDVATLSIVPNDSTALAKPLVVSTAEKSKQDIVHYTVVPGDTVDSLSAKFGVTADSIKWSNNITGNFLTAGLKLVIPPVNGIVYTVKSGDTPASLASKYKTDQNAIISFNDAEISGLNPGEQIVIPNGSIAPVITYSAYTYLGGSASYASGGGCYYKGSTYPNYGYDCGYCTWWVAYLRAQSGNPVPSNLGNASTWAILARSYGLSTGDQPRVGAAVVTSTRGAGHIAYVTAVNGDGTITVSEMNVLGWGVTDTATIPAQQSSSDAYIY